MRPILTILGAVAVLVAFLGFLAGIQSCGPGPVPARYNVLLVTLDTTRADRLGCYGYARPTSPHLDDLAAESVVFEKAIAQAAVTPVSHASILTGLEPYHHGLRVLHGLVANRLEDDVTTLAEIWRLTGGPTVAFVSAYPVASPFGLYQGFDYFDEDFPQSDGEGLVSRKGTVNTGESQRRADATTDRALQWLEGHLPADVPFLMWVHYFDPHDGIVTPPQGLLNEQLSSVFRPASGSRADLLRGLYDCEVHFMDAQIGRLLDAFRDHGLWENTVVVVVADHGEALGDHDWWTHGILYQEQIRVPLIIRVPGVGAGTRVNSLVRTIDLMPTILEEAGVAPDLWPSVDGAGLSEALRHGELSVPRSAYSESVNMLHYGRPDTTGRRDAKDDKYYCLMDADQKLIYHQLRPAESEYYDLNRDPHELANMAPQSSAAMEDLMKELRSLKVFSPIMPGMTATDLERQERLRSLGYIQ